MRSGREHASDMPQALEVQVARSIHVLLSSEMNSYCIKIVSLRKCYCRISSLHLGRMRQLSKRARPRAGRSVDSRTSAGPKESGAPALLREIPSNLNL